MGYSNIALQIYYGCEEIESKIVLICVCYLSLIKTFQFLKMILEFSYIVTMLTRVIQEIQVFIMYFIIQVFIISMAFGVVCKIQGDEYRHVGTFWANLIWTFRVSLGDFNFDFGDDMQEGDV